MVEKFGSEFVRDVGTEGGIHFGELGSEDVSQGADEAGSLYAADIAPFEAMHCVLWLKKLSKVVNIVLRW